MLAKRWSAVENEQPVTYGNTDTFLAAFGGEWDVEDWLYEFEVSSAGADTEDFALTTIFQFNDPTNNNFHSVGAKKCPLFTTLEMMTYLMALSTMLHCESVARSGLLLFIK